MAAQSPTRRNCTFGCRRQDGNAPSPLVHLTGSGRQLTGSRHFSSEIHLLFPQWGQYDYVHSHWSLLLWATDTVARFPGPGTKATTGGRSWLDFIGDKHFRSILKQPPPSADKAAETQCIIMGRSWVQACCSFSRGQCARNQRSWHPLCQPWPPGLQVPQWQNEDNESPSLINCRKY